MLLYCVHLDNVEFGKQVAVCQGEGVTIQIEAWGFRDIWVLVKLMGKRHFQEHIQLHQSRQKFLLQHWKRAIYGYTVIPMRHSLPHVAIQCNLLMLLLSFNPGLGFFMYAENLRKMSSPAPLDSLYRQHNLGYLWLVKIKSVCVNYMVADNLTAYGFKRIYSLWWC